MAIKIKTQAEINLMRESGHILANVFKEVEKIIQPGISTKEIDKFVYDYIRKHNAKPSFKGYGNPPFPGSVCASINNEVIHGIPSKKKILKDGDIIGLDIGVYFKGYHSDRAFTYKVGNVSEDAARLIEVTMESFFNGVKKIKDGVHLGDVSHAIQKTAEDAGYSLVREFQGHGVGANLHEEPAVPNRGKQGAGPILKTNMVIAIEPMVNMGHHAILIEDDDWTIITRDGSLSAHYEHTVAVKEIRVSTSLLMRTIIAGKDDDSIVIQTFFFQLLHQLPHVNVQAGHHRCKSSMRIKLSTIASFAESRMTGFSTLESFLRILTAELTDNAVLGHNQFCMRQDGRIPQKERFIRRGIVQVFQGFLVNKIRSIRSTSVLYLKDIVLQVDTLTVVPQMVRIIAMRQKLAIKTEESIAALCLRITRGSDKA